MARGTSLEYKPNASLEILDIGRRSLNWDFILLENVSPRKDCLICPVSPKELLLLGGTGKGHLADAYLMDIETNKARNIKEDKGMPVWASS